LPYSLHPKQWLASVPIKIENLKRFKPEDAKPERVKTDVEFLVNKENEATELLLQALEWKSKQPKEIIREVRIGFKSKTPVSEEYFPPCIKLILSGLKDGRKIRRRIGNQSGNLKTLMRHRYAANKNQGRLYEIFNSTNEQ
jgi:hypothetical protein